MNWREPSAWAPPLVMALMMVLLVRMCGINIPYNDDFDSPGWMLFDWLQGNFGWHSLWQQHNESRLVIPRIIWLVEAFTVGWSTKHWMYASVLMCAVEVYLLVLLVGRIVRSVVLKWEVAVCLSLLLLHPQFGPGTFLRGSQGIVLIPSLFIVIGLVLYSCRISFRLKLLAYVILAEISTLTFSSGMIVWILLFPCFPLLHALRDPLQDRRTILFLTFLACLCALVGVGSYFVGFEGSPFTWPDNGLAGFLTYFFSWMGAGLASIGDSRAAVAFGIGLFVCSALCLALATAEAVKDRSLVRLEGAWPWLMLLIYVFVSGLVNALIRNPFGIQNAIAGRYYLITIQMTIGLAGLAPILICYRADGSDRKYQPGGRAFVSAFMVGGIVYGVAGWQSGIKHSQGYYQALVRRKLALSLWRECPFISPLPISADAPLKRRRTHYLALTQAGLCPDYSDGPWLMKALKAARSLEPVGEVRVRGVGEKLNASGWAMDPVSRMPFPAVLTVVAEQDSKLTPISVDLMSKKGPPLPGRLDAEDSFFLMGFNTYPLQNDHASVPTDRLLFFAIDPENHEAYPIRRIR